MIQKYGRLALVLVMVFGAMILLAPSEDRPDLLLGFGLASALIALLLNRSVTGFAMRHPRALMWVGIGLSAAAVLVLVASFTFAPSLGVNVTAGIFSGLMLLGISLIFLPHSSKQMERARAQVAASTAAPARRPQFEAVQEVIDTLKLLFGERQAVARVIGPWFVLFCVVPLLFVDMTFWKPFIEQHTSQALLLLVLVVFGMIGILVVSTIQWVRFLGAGRAPRIVDFPVVALWGFAWRLVIYGSVLRAVGQIEPWLQVHLPITDAWAISGLSGLVSLIVLVLSSPFAIVLVPVALGAADKSFATSSAAFSSAGPGLYLSVLLILTPIYLLSWLTGLGPAAPKDPSADLLRGVLWSLAVFLTTTVAATFLTRLYLRNQAAELPSGFA